MADFPAVYQRLKAILEPYGRRMHVSGDGPTGYGVDMAAEVADAYPAAIRRADLEVDV